jgi:DNA-binding MarR family transcriptional regulator
MSSIMPKDVDNVKQVGAPPGSVPSDGDVLELVHAVMHAYRSRQYRFLRDGPHAITHMDGKVLAFFSKHPGATPGDLAAHSGRDKAQLARLVKGLKEQGLLAAKADTADRRLVRLTLTPAGDDVARALRRQAGRLVEQAVTGLAARERQLLLALLQRVKNNLDGESAAGN